MSETARFEDHESSRPWFRQPWFWFLVLFPAASITYCIVAITLSMTTHTSMVVDDYSKEGLAINQSLARDAKAAELGLEARIQQTGRNLEVTLASSDKGTGVAPEYLILQLFHPTMGEQDRIIQLSPTGEGHYRGQIAGNIDGRWYLDVSGPSSDWRIKGEGHFPADSAIVMRPNDPERG
ncbi:FixH family protein [Marinobacter sp. AN1]|uniref:FixH family protein n=1 Tax=Marinobacter sp. AN1 TaxID=2886046 RepID=UPI00222FE5BF|nr:FixH family protein [Marinobacter sp. AN1]UZD67364.1 FixH family protein [Marinobacter sp. AN1]